jgi:predicted cupin superfamily sugar epimerase/mannose-6-phosphate isomerase-like protein (cupin superfamily)
VALVTRRDFSAMHRLTTAETWHFYGGDPAELLLLHPDGLAEVVEFGPDPLAGQRPQVTVPEGVWMGARPARDDVAAYSFFGCTLAPGFDYGDYEHGYRGELQAGWPEVAELIAGLTREDSIMRSQEAVSAPAGGGLVSRVFEAADVPAFSPAQGVSLRELVGRGAATRTEAVSCARFRLEAGASSGSSRYHGCDEFFVVLSGKGVATLNGVETAVGPGSVVAIAKGDPHALHADEAEALEFMAVLAPAFDPGLYAPEAGGSG